MTSQQYKVEMKIGPLSTEAAIKLTNYLETNSYRCHEWLPREEPSALYVIAISNIALMPIHSRDDYKAAMTFAIREVLHMNVGVSMTFNPIADLPADSKGREKEILQDLKDLFSSIQNLRAMFQIFMGSSGFSIFDVKKSLEWSAEVLRKMQDKYPELNDMKPSISTQPEFMNPSKRIGWTPLKPGD